MEIEKRRGKGLRAQCFSVAVFRAVWHHCSISLAWPSQKQILHSLPLSSHLPPLPPVISPPLAPVIPPPAPLTAHPFFPPVPILSFLSFNFSSADPHPPLLILNVLFFSLQCNILSCFAFLLYTHPRSPCPVAGV